MKIRLKSNAPLSKVTAGALSGAIVVILVFICEVFLHTPVSDTVSSALTVVVSFVVSYFVPMTTEELRKQGLTEVNHTHA